MNRGSVLASTLLLLLVPWLPLPALASSSKVRTLPISSSSISNSACICISFFSLMIQEELIKIYYLFSCLIITLVISGLYCIHGWEETRWSLHGHRITPRRACICSWKVLALACGDHSSCNLPIWLWTVLTYSSSSWNNGTVRRRPWRP